MSFSPDQNVTELQHTLNCSANLLPVVQDIVGLDSGAAHQVLPVVHSLHVNVHQYPVDLGHGTLETAAWHCLVVLGLTQGLRLQSLYTGSNVDKP